MAFYIAPAFLEKLAIHITKNYLNLPNVKVPLILGVHGRKGEGKTFQCDLVFEKMALSVVQMSAGELESPDAGDPARLIRMRYREAGEMVKVRGKMAVLVIQDIDAGIGRVDQMTQYTVNTQLVNGTLMNIADTPTNVQLPGSYDASPTQRIPIITGNDFSTLYAPLVRDGRMEKYYWEPTRDNRIGIVFGIFSGDRVSEGDVAKLIDIFPTQSIDFYGALRSRLYDEQVSAFIRTVGLEGLSNRIVNSNEKQPEFKSPDFGLNHLIEVGNSIVREQRRIQELRLVEEYNQGIKPRSSEPVNHSPTPQSSSPIGQSSNTRVTPDVVSEINRILSQGDRVGIEYVDKRRFQTGSWTCCGTFEGNASDAIAALETCLMEHDRDYIRLVGISKQGRSRLTEMMVQRS
ncbi:MAG: ribulose bisphosphate carboxylase small subunit [Cyanobacteria bacterium]|nr:ribulose bisphosphate carboxylase small subunit [Cyanobacteriota bacterium]